MKKIILLLLLFPYTFCVFSQTDANQKLWTALNDNSLENAKQAIVEGVDVNAKDKNNVPMLWWAVFKSDLSLVKYLVKQGAEYQPNRSVIACGGHCFYGNLTGIAAGENKLEILKYLIETLKVPVDDKEWYPERQCFCGWTALQWSLDKKFDPITTYLLEKRASLEVVDKNDFSIFEKELQKYYNKFTNTSPCV